MQISLKRPAVLFGICILVHSILLANNPVLAETLFPGDSGQSLLQEVASEFRPSSTMSYKNARDLMYSNLDNENGVVSGIYTNFQVSVDPNSRNPRQDAFLSGRGINAEHVWPQSKGASGQAKSDLHHLFPSKVAVNGDRGNKPFAEILDVQTKRWYRDREKLQHIPRTNIDEYSESTSGFFEPREDKKGDVARAMFYFYTMYKSKADSEDSRFFSRQRSTLCQWNKLDPVSNEEVTRSHQISQSPQGNENPFIIDSTLADRAYCN